jgi:hypothetical protein
LTPNAVNRARSVRLAVAAGALLLLVTLPARGEPPVSNAPLSLALAPGASLELDGDSSLHRYSAKAHGIQAAVVLDPARVVTPAQRLDLEALIRGHFIKTFQLSMPVVELTSGDHGLDDNMHKALKGGEFKQIRFQMDSYEVLPPPPGGPAFTVTIHGRLSLAGVERKIDVSATGVRIRGAIRINGSKDLLMTDYQIKPPTMMLGAIKTKNLITVKFNATLQKDSKS